jgi:hypothetical protein
VPLIEFLVQRGRLLAELGESGPNGRLLEALQDCRQVGRGRGYALFLGLLDEALAFAAPSKTLAV